jgi:peroxiredoxin
MLFAGLVTGVSAYQARHLPTEAPTLSLPTLDGGTLNSKDLLGKPTMIVVWAPWCGVCGAESDNVDRVRGLVGGAANVVTIATGYVGVDGLESVTVFVAKHSVEASVGLDVDNSVAKALSVRSFPTTFFLDRDGRIDGAVVGYTSTVGMLARLWWAS